MAKQTQVSYQEAIEASTGLMNSDDNEDITNEVLKESTGAKRTASVPEVEETDEEEPEEGQLPDAEGTKETEEESEPSYKKDQVQKIVQTRVNTYTKRIEKLQRYKTAVDRICDITGLDFDKLVNRLTSMSVQEQAKILGVPVEQVVQAQETRRQIEQENKKNRSLQRQLDETKLKADPRFHDYDLYKEEIDELLDDNPKLTVKQAYFLAKGETALAATARDAEQRAIANRVNAQKKSVVKPSGSTGAQGPKVNQVILSAAKRVGMDPVEYATFQEIDNIDAYRAMKNKKKS